MVKINSYIGTAATNLIVMALTLVQGAVLARMLGPDGRGGFQAATYYPILFASIGVLGVNAALARVAARTPEKKDLKIFALFCALTTSGVTTGLCWFLMPALLENSGEKLVELARLFVWFIPVNHFGLLLQSIDQGRQNFKRYNVVKLVLNPIFLTGLFISWIFCDEKLYWSVCSLLFSNIAAVAIRLFSHRGSWGWGIETGAQLKAFLIDAFRFYLVGVAALAFQQIDKVIALNMLTTAQLGLYTVAASVASVISILNLSFSTVVFSEGMRESGDRDRLARLLRVAIAVSITVGGMFAIFVPNIFILVYGSAFSEAIPLVLILIPSVLLGSTGVIFDEHFRGAGRPYVGAVVSLVGAVSLIISSYVLVPLFGLRGIAASCCISTFVYFFMFVMFAAREFSCQVIDFFPRSSDVLAMIRFVLKKFGRTY